jgi:periplasmic divalent cation tolerance protein
VVPLDESEARIVLITHPVEGAEGFARGLVDRRLAACVNLLPVHSVYRWQGTIESEDERLLVVKTRAGRVDDLERHVASEHPYDVPELVVLDPARVARDYGAWIVAETAGD